MMLSWRYVYARPVWLRSDVDRFKQLMDAGATRYAERVIAQTMTWLPWWRRR